MTADGESYEMTGAGLAAAEIIGPVSGSLEDPAVAVTGTDASDVVVTLTFSGGTAGDGATITYDAAKGLGEPTA